MAKPRSTSKASRKDVYADVTERVIAALEAGTVPWRQPWTATAGLPMSMSSGKPYRGVNVFLLHMEALLSGYTSRWWGTYKQITERGGQVTKGQKSTSVILWRRFEKEVDGEEKSFMILRTFNVFNTDQAEWAEGSRKPNEGDRTFDNDPIDRCEALTADYLANGPSFTEGGGRAYYSKASDSIVVPDLAHHTSAEEYYSTKFHEVTHSTGHASRLNREGIVEGHRFGDTLYSREELIAEMGAAMMCGLAGIEQVTLDNSASYLANWLDALKGDTKLIVQAGAAAQRAVDLATSATFETEDADDKEAVAA